MNPELIAYMFPFTILFMILFAAYIGEHADKIPFLKDLVD